MALLVARESESAPSFRADGIGTLKPEEMEAEEPMKCQVEQTGERATQKTDSEGISCISQVSPATLIKVAGHRRANGVGRV